MGWEARRVGVTVSCRVSRHNSKQDVHDEALVDELERRMREAVRPIIENARYEGVLLYAEGLE